MKRKKGPQLFHEVVHQAWQLGWTLEKIAKALGYAGVGEVAEAILRPRYISSGRLALLLELKARVDALVEATPQDTPFINNTPLKPIIARPLPPLRGRAAFLRGQLPWQQRGDPAGAVWRALVLFAVRAKSWGIRPHMDSLSKVTLELLSVPEEQWLKILEHRTFSQFTVETTLKALRHSGDATKHDDGFWSMPQTGIEQVCEMLHCDAINPDWALIESRLREQAYIDSFTAVIKELRHTYDKLFSRTA